MAAGGHCEGVIAVFTGCGEGSDGVMKTADNGGVLVMVYQSVLFISRPVVPSFAVTASR